MKTELENRVLLPKNPFTEAANYTLAREDALRAFLEYPSVPIDTNHGRPPSNPAVASGGTVRVLKHPPFAAG